MIWHSAKQSEIEKELNTNISLGLNAEAAEKRLAEFGPNQLAEKRKKTFIQRYIDQLKDFMVIILIIASAISLVTTILEGGNLLEPFVIVAIVVLNAFLGVIQESKAEKALDALKSMSSPSAKVIRDGNLSVIKATGLVPGDLIMLEAGDFIPADARIIESASFRCDESTLTGENIPAEKSESAEVLDIAPVGDRLNMVYTGCSVVYGRAKAIVTETGMQTEIGKIALLLENEKETLTPLQKRLANLGKMLGILAIVICVIIFIVGMAVGQHIFEMFMTAVSLAVAAIPEGLPAIVTIVLALGVGRMVKRNAIIRRIPAVETLGSTSVICSDKTGTLTQNKMTLVSAFTSQGFVPSLEELSDASITLLRFAAICCDAKMEIKDGKEIQIGDPTETALVYAAYKYTGIDKSTLDNIYPRLAEIPFDSDRKLMTTVNMISGKPVAIVKGAPDIMFERCINIDKKAAKEANEEMASKALRVLAICYKPLTAIPTDPSPEEMENNLTFLGLVGLIDPPREEAKEAIKVCKSAGIIPVMITGDHITTARAIATELGILEDNHVAITGETLNAMSDEELTEKIRSIRVYARVSPEDKIRIVKAWKDIGEVVAMTGDGVNDAPALKAADIGCAMGITGTDVAKGAADMVLTDDNFATIVSAVEEGRGIYANIKKAVHFLIGCNLGEIICVFLAILIWHKSPLLAMQILWVNLVTDGLSALALGMEPSDYDIMTKKPVSPKEGIFSNGLLAKVVASGIVVGGVTLIAYALGLSQNEHYAETMAFATLAFSQLVNSFNVRSGHSLFKIGVFSNKYINLAFLASTALMLIALLTPAKVIFSLVALDPKDWIIVAALSFSPFIIFEIYKLIESMVKRNKIID